MSLERFAAILILLIAECVAVPIFFLQEPKDVVVRGGDNITLDCIFSESAPKCYWSINDEPVEIGNRYELIGDQSTGNCTLKIRHAVPHFDEGLWTCGYPKDSHTNYAPRSRGSQVKVQALDHLDVIEKSEVGSGEEPKTVSWEIVQVGQPDILKEEHLVAQKIILEEENAPDSDTGKENDNRILESGSGDFKELIALQN